MITWVIGKWYRTRDGEVGQCVSTDGVGKYNSHPQPIYVMFGVRFEVDRHYCVGGEFYRPGIESCNDIIAGPFDSAEAAKQSPPVAPQRAGEAMHWDKVLATRLRTKGISDVLIGAIVGLVAEHRMQADKEGYSRGYNAGWEDRSGYKTKE